MRALLFAPVGALAFALAACGDVTKDISKYCPDVASSESAGETPCAIVAARDDEAIGVYAVVQDTDYVVLDENLERKVVDAGELKAMFSTSELKVLPAAPSEQ